MYFSITRTRITEILSALLILLFVYTAISKLGNLALFRFSLMKSPLLSGYYHILVIAVPVFELFLAILLFIPRSRKTGFLLSMLLMALFTLYIGYMLLFIPHLPCSCGGVLRALGWRNHLLFNILFTGIAAAGWVLLRRQNRIAINRRFA